jgi:hypothetical protein
LPLGRTGCRRHRGAPPPPNVLFSHRRVVKQSICAPRPAASPGATRAMARGPLETLPPTRQWVSVEVRSNGVKRQGDDLSLRYTKDG